MSKLTYSGIVAKINNPLDRTNLCVSRKTMERAVKAYNELPKSPKQAELDGYTVDKLTTCTFQDDVFGTITIKDNKKGQALQDLVRSGVGLNMSVGGLYIPGQEEYDNDDFKIHTVMVIPPIQDTDEKPPIEVLPIEDLTNNGIFGTMSWDSKVVTSYEDFHINLKRLVLGWVAWAALLLAVAVYAN